MSDENYQGQICSVPAHLFLFGPDIPETEETKKVCERWAKLESKAEDILNLERSEKYAGKSPRRILTDEEKIERDAAFERVNQMQIQEESGSKELNFTATSELRWLEVFDESEMQGPTVTNRIGWQTDCYKLQQKFVALGPKHTSIPAIRGYVIEREVLAEEWRDVPIAS